MISGFQFYHCFLKIIKIKGYTSETKECIAEKLYDNKDCVGEHTSINVAHNTLGKATFYNCW